MTSSPDIIIVGAGIVGAACALECARGGLEVLVLDRSTIGSGTTAAGMGHIVVMDDSEAQFALTHYSRQLWLALRPELPGDAEYEICGTLWVAADRGRLTAAKVAADVGRGDYAVMLCGSMPFVRALARQFRELGVKRRRIITEELEFRSTIAPMPARGDRSGDKPAAPH